MNSSAEHIPKQSATTSKKKKRKLKKRLVIKCWPKRKRSSPPPLPPPPLLLLQPSPTGPSTPYRIPSITVSSLDAIKNVHWENSRCTDDVHVDLSESSSSVTTSPRHSWEEETEFLAAVEESRAERRKTLLEISLSCEPSASLQPTSVLSLFLEPDDPPAALSPGPEESDLPPASVAGSNCEAVEYVVDMVRSKC